PEPRQKEVDNILDFIKTDEQKLLLGLIFGSIEIQRPFVAPPEIPSDRAAALRNALIEMANDPDFIQDASKSGLDYRAITAEQIAAVLEANYGAPRALVDRAGRILNQK